MKEEKALGVNALKISLAAARVNAGMTQVDVAKALHVSNKTVVNWETGKVDTPFIALEALARLYGVPMEFFRLPKESA